MKFQVSPALVSIAQRMSTSTSRWVALSGAAVIAASSMVHAANPPIPSTPPPDCGKCGLCILAGSDPDSGSGSLRWTAYLGSTRWNRVTDNLSLFRVAPAEGSVSGTLPRDFTSVTGQQYTSAATTNRHQLAVTMSSDKLTATLATPAALVWADGSKAEFVKVSGVTRQVVTDDGFTDVRMSDDNSHMVVKIWAITGALGAKVSGLYTRPAHTPLSETRFQYSAPAAGTTRLDITTIENTGVAGTRTIVERLTQTTSPDQMIVQTWKTPPEPATCSRRKRSPTRPAGRRPETTRWCARSRRQASPPPASLADLKS